jgi:hypothetical protein
MEVRIGYGFPSSLPAASSTGRGPEIRDSAKNSPSLQYDDSLPAQLAANGNSPRITRLTSETREETESGYRRTQVFEQADGRNFTRVEDVAITATGSRRAVIQQNPSGSITRYEEVLDREPSGTFRRTQRFQDETGQSATEITANYKVTDHYVLSGGSMGARAGIPQGNTTPSRGVYIDIQM